MDLPAFRNRLTGLLLAVTLPVLLTGCSSGTAGGSAGKSSASPTPPGSTQPAADSVPAALAGLPLAAYQADAQDVQQEVLVQTSLAVSCMHKAGFLLFTGADYQNPGSPSEDVTPLPSGAWGFLGTKAAATQGFHPAARPGPVASPQPAAPGNSEAYVTARVDCDRQITDQLKPADQPGTDLVNRLSAESLQDASRDTRVTAATRSWADCMAKSGHPATDPTALPEQYRNNGTTPTAPELATAAADADCTTRSGLAGVYFAVTAGYQKQQIDENSTALTAHQQSLKDQAQRLTKLLTASP